MIDSNCLKVPRRPQGLVFQRLKWQQLLSAVLSNTKSYKVLANKMIFCAFQLFILQHQNHFKITNLYDLRGTIYEVRFFNIPPKIVNRTS